MGSNDVLSLDFVGEYVVSRLPVPERHVMQYVGQTVLQAARALVVLLESPQNAVSIIARGDFEGRGFPLAVTLRNEVPGGP